MFTDGLMRRDFILKDIEIAKKALNEVKLDDLYGLNGLVWELYSIPSHNHHTYYARIYQSENVDKIVFAKSAVYDKMIGETINMYPFCDVIKLKRLARYQTKIICGCYSLSENVINILKEIESVLPDGILWEDSEVLIDGQFQMLRYYVNGNAKKEYAFYNNGLSCISDKKTDVYRYIIHLYEWIEREICR